MKVIERLLVGAQAGAKLGWVIKVHSHALLYIPSLVDEKQKCGLGVTAHEGGESRNFFFV